MGTEVLLQIDGRTVTAKEGDSVLEAALSAGIYIPHLCHHPALSVQGACKLCAVEIQGVDGPVTACTTSVQAGMAVRTRTEGVVHLRNVATELMLACHPADCTSCAAYLNCELQNLMQYLGVAHSRLRRIEKRNVRMASGPPNPLMKREMERCIQCGRCVRACDELRGVGALEYRTRDGESYVGIKNDVSLTESDCRFCGACVEVCPTGAILDMPGIFVSDVPRNQALIPCKNACPAHTDIPAYVRLTRAGRYAEAVEVLREKLTFPHVLGLVCSHKCELSCKRRWLDDTVSIREIKRFAVENDDQKSWREKVIMKPETGKRVAIVGAGPAGMTAAWYLAKQGHKVTVYERQEKPGGMMQYGIPDYRLPREVVRAEIDIIQELGVSVQLNDPVESAVKLKAAFDAVLVAVGAQRGNIPFKGVEACKNVWNAVDFCRWASQNRLPDMGGTLTVLGGGNVAFDCARIAKKAGVRQVRLLCLEARDKMLADREEVRDGIKEGVEVLNGMNTAEMKRQDDRIRALKAMSIKSFHFGAKGLELEVVENSEVWFKTDSLVFAMGQSVELPSAFGLERGRANTVQVDADLQSSEEGIYAAGDAVTGTRSIVEAIDAATKAASCIDRYLGGDGAVEDSYWNREAPAPKLNVIENFSALPWRETLCTKDQTEQACVRCLQCDLRLQLPKVLFWGDPKYQKSRKEARDDL